MKKVVDNILLLVILAIIIILAYFLFIRQDDKIDNKNDEELIIENIYISLKVKEEGKVNAYIKNNPNAKIIFNSSDKNLLSVLDDGTIKGLAVGNTSVIVSFVNSNGDLISKECYVDILENEKMIINSVSFKGKNLVITKNNRYQLEYDIKPVGNEYESISFTSSNTNIVRVDNKGLITTVNKGKAQITITINNIIKAYLDVYVVDANIVTSYVELPTSIVLSKNNIELTEEDEYDISYTILPSNISKDLVTITSSDSSIVLVSGNRIRAIKEGTAVVNIETFNGIKASITVKVNKKVKKVQGISITSEKNITLEPSKTSQITYSILPTDADNKSVLFTSSNSSVATVSSTGLITAISSGNTIITITTIDGGFSDTINVSVTNNNNNNNNNNEYVFSCPKGASPTSGLKSCTAVSHQLTVSATTVTLPSGGSTTIHVTLPKECGDIMNVTRRSNGGETNWSSYVSQSITNTSLGGYDWVITANKGKKGTVLLSQTVQFDVRDSNGCTANVKSMKMITVKIQ